MSAKTIASNCQTIYTENHNSFKWSIDKRCIEVLELNKHLKSTNIKESGHNPNDNNWCLYLSQITRIRSVSGWSTRVNEIVIYLVRTNGPDVLNHYEISLLKTNGKKRMSSDTTSKFEFTKTNNQVEVYFIDKAVLMNEANGLFVDNQLIILCELKEICEPKTTSVSVESKPLVTDKKCYAIQHKLCSDLSELLESGKGSDVILVTNKREFKAHKAILMARSVVFSAMFGHTMEEKITNRVVIKDIDSEVIHAMLKYIYTGRVGNLRELGADLLAAADKYGLDQLKIICEVSLFTTTTVENAIQVLLMSDSLKAYKLKSHSIDFINKNTKEVMKTGDWKSLLASHPNLINAIILARKYYPSLNKCLSK